MLTKIKSIYRRLPSFSPRFHIAFGLSSLLTAVVLLSMFFGFVPDRNGALVHGRVALAEAVSSTSSILLKRGDLPGMRGAIEFVVQRNTDLHAVELLRASDKSRIYFGLEQGSAEFAQYTSPLSESELLNTSLVSGSIVTVPLLRGDEEWGQMYFQFAVPKNVSVMDKIRESPFSLMAFIGLISFPMFYFYLGKMLKELNPSTAVPARVRSALDTIAESLLVLDGRGNVVLANAAFAELNGRSADELLGQRADSLPWIQADPDNPSYPWQQAFATGESTRMDMVGYKDKENEERKFIVNCSPVMGAKGKVGGVLISMDDVTLLEEKELLLRQSMEEAEAANEAKTTFLSNMSHEIRTPMTAILGFTEVLKRNKHQSENDRQRHLATISNSGTHLLELINDVLDLSKVESGAMEVESITCKAAYIANEVVHVLKVKAREKGIELNMDIASSLPEHILSDPARLRQIVTNLVGNAIKFTETGGVTVRIDCTEDKTDQRLQIAVIDSGIGMSEQQLSTIFEAFIQADASITRRFGGTGLGLSISRKLALAMQGDIVVTSKQGEGSNFMLTLPVGDITDVPVLSAEEVYASFAEMETSIEKIWTFPKSRALVVDDGPENRELLAVVLGDLGIDIETAENGKEGLDAAMAADFDVVLMDIQMPVMDGYQSVAAMREAGLTLPIVALTANAMKGYEQKVLSAGFSHYMTKPIDLDRLTQMLADLLGGTYTESDEETIAIAVTENDVSQELEMGSGPVLSAMAALNPKFESIAKQFVERLDDRIELMQACIDAEDFEELAKHAHWLKGSGGTVGFTQFALPAKELELAAKSASTEDAHQYLGIVKNIQARIEFPVDADSDTAVQSVNQRTKSAADTHNSSILGESTVCKAANDEEAYGEPVMSSLPMNNPRFRDIVEKFIPRLDEQMLAIRAALNDEEFEELAQLAHWLKGSGGNVGYDGFLELAANLETSAKSSNKDDSENAFIAVQHYSERVKQGWEMLEPLEKSA